MIEAPFGFFEVVIEVLPANAAKFCQAQFGVAPVHFSHAVSGAQPADCVTTSRGSQGSLLLLL